MTSTADIAAAEKQRDRGLVPGIGTVALTANFISVIIGSGIYTIPRDIAAAVGPWAPLIYLAGAITMVAIMLCFAEASARVPTSGGVYGFVGAAFGPYWGWMTGVLNWASCAVTAGAIAAAAADAGSTLLPGLAAAPGGGVAPLRAAAIIGWFALLTIVNTRGVAAMARFVTGITAIKLLPLALFIGIGAFYIDPANLRAPLPGGHADIGRAAILGLFIFTGIEVGLSVSGEVRNPARTIPRAIAMALGLSVALYLCIQVVAQGLAGPGLANAAAPLAAALGRVSPGLGTIMVLGALVSMLGYLASDAMSSPRLLLAFSRDGYLPAVLGRVDVRHHSPGVAVALHCAIAAAMALSGTFTALVIVATLVTIIVYTIGCAAALQLRRRDVALAGPVARIPGLLPAALLAFGAMGWLTLQSTRSEATGIAIMIAIFSVLYRFRRQPRVDP